MAKVVVSPTAAASLGWLIESHSLPPDTPARVWRSLRHLQRFPRSGRVLGGEGHEGLRFVLGPWRWLVVVYEYRLEDDLVWVLVFEDGRVSRAATNYRA